MDNVLTNQERINRVLKGILDHTQQEAEHRVRNPFQTKNDPHDLADTIRHYQNLVRRYRKDKNKQPGERATLRYLRHEVRRLTARQKPTLGKRLLYSRPVNNAFNYLLGRYGNYSQHRKEVGTLEAGTLLNHNLQHLQAKLNGLGFDQDLKVTLLNQLSHNLDEFSFRHNQPRYKDMEFVIHFKKIPGTDAYDLVSFDAMKRKTDTEANDPNFKQLRINYARQQGIEFSAQDATNIAHNRPVMKDVQGHDVWFVPDASQAKGYRHGNLNVEKELEAWPIKELQTPGARENLVKGLQDGQVREITVQLPDKSEAQWKVAVRSDGEGLTFTDKDGKHLDPFRHMQKNEHLEKLLNKGLAQKNGNKKAPPQRPGAKVRH